MTFNGADLLIVAILLAVASLLTYASSKRLFQRWAAESKEVTERQLSALAGTIKLLETQVAELSKAAISPSITKSDPAPAPVLQAQAKEEEIAPEMLIVLAAAVTAYLGKKVRIRSAKMLQSPYEIVNPWSQQGRVIVQASHNLRPRG